MRRTGGRARRAAAAAALCLLAAAGGAFSPGRPAAAGARAPAQASDTVDVQLLAFNDLHGYLAPPPGANGRVHATAAGGVEFLAAHLRRAAARNPHTIVVAAGDLVGASPLLSAAYHDEPTIEALNALGLAVSSIGNHELDHGPAELLRLQRGGCHPRDGCAPGDRFAGARFEYLAANVVNRSSGKPILPPTAVRAVGAVRIGFIGETLRDTPQLVMRGRLRGLSFLDEATTANRYAAELERQGVHAIVLLIHEGGRQAPEDADADPNGCEGFSGPIAEIAARLSRDIRVVVSGHTHRFYNCEFEGRRVNSAGSYGRLFTRINLSIDRATGAIAAVRASNEVVSRDIEPDRDEHRLVERYDALSRPAADRLVGRIAADLLRTTNAAGESVLGDIVADSQLTAARAIRGGAAVAFMNPGGMRADLLFGEDGRVRYGDVFTVLPFGNLVATVAMTGRQVLDLLEQQFDNPRPGQATILQVSEGFSYRYALHAPHGRHVDLDSLAIAGRPIRPDDRLRVAASSFLVGGGDNFTAFRRGTGRRTGGTDLDALIAYLRARSPVAPTPRNRIVRTD